MTRGQEAEAAAAAHCCCCYRCEAPQGRLATQLHASVTQHWRDRWATRPAHHHHHFRKLSRSGATQVVRLRGKRNGGLRRLQLSQNHQQESLGKSAAAATAAAHRAQVRSCEQEERGAQGEVTQVLLPHRRHLEPH